MDVSRYFLSASASNQETLLADWQWLLRNERFQIYRATCLGDFFLRDAIGKIHFLDTMEGNLNLFAGSNEEFESKMQDRHVRQRYLATFLVRDLAEAGILLGPSECYSPIHPPILGGDLSRENLQPTDILVHTSMMGQLHRQVRDLPPGTPIQSIRFE